MRLRSLLALLCLLAAGLAAGCGGDGGQSASEAWAEDFCSAAGEWRSSVDDAVAEVSDSEQLSYETIRGAIDDGLEATEELVDDLRAVGPPETEAGAEAASVVESLADGLETDVDELRAALGTETESLSELVQKAAQAVGLVQQMAQELRASVQELEGLDPAEELADALRSNEECADARAGGGNR